MAVMMNTLGRRAQAQSDTQVQTQATGQEGEAPPKEKVEIHHNFSSYFVHFSFLKKLIPLHHSINKLFLCVFPHIP